MVNPQTDKDNLTIFSRLWGILGELRHKRTALAKRDLCMRRISAERDPGNQVAMQLFGSELTNTLVQALWGSDRTSITEQ